MVRTPKQVKANRRNARKSTGPRTAGGKARSSQNALTHGLFSRTALVRGEDEAVLAALRADLVARLDPIDELERLLADRVVTAAWRLRRAGRYEREVLEYEWADQRCQRRECPALYEDDPALCIGEVVVRLMRLDVLPKLSRYEGRIERGLYRALHELQRVQAARRGQQVAAPIALDVSVDGGDAA